MNLDAEVLDFVFRSIKLWFAPQNLIPDNFSMAWDCWNLHITDGRLLIRDGSEVLLSCLWNSIKWSNSYFFHSCLAIWLFYFYPYALFLSLHWLLNLFFLQLLFFIERNKSRKTTKVKNIRRGEKILLCYSITGSLCIWAYRPCVPSN